MESKKEKLVEEIAKKYNLKMILLFGSQASGQAHKESDFDIAYLSERELDLTEESRLIIELIPIFKSENIDLVDLQKATPLLFYAIFNNCRVVYKKDELIFPSMRAYAFKKYIETKPLYELKFKRFQEKVSQL